jgi:hypothetical protein
LRGSPIRDVSNVKIPLLMLHGREDRRVPVTQAIGFMRGLIREGSKGRESQLVIYPREGHRYEEQGHAEDYCRRLVEYLDNRLRTSPFPSPNCMGYPGALSPLKHYSANLVFTESKSFELSSEF